MQDAVSSNREVRIAYLGPSASFSHQAVLESCSSHPSITACPLPSFDAIFASIQKSSKSTGETFDFALLPVENSTNGGVVPVLDLLTKCDAVSEASLYPDIEVVGEHYLKVHHCLFIHPSALRGFGDESERGTISDLSSTPLCERYNVTTLYTHPQVWGQCSKFLARHFPQPEVERRNLSSTSAAAQYVARNSPIANGGDEANANTVAGSKRDNDNDRDHSPPPITPRASETGTIAAICSSLAGAQNNLANLALNIEDEPGKNTTRFLVIRNKQRPHLNITARNQFPWLSPSSPLPPPQPSDPALLLPTFYKSLIMFTIPHSTPGSLAKALSVFQKHGFNLTAIDTRPSHERPWHYVFFVECEEKRLLPPPPLSEANANENDESNDQKVEVMFRELSAFTERSTFLGSWINMLRHH